MVTRETLRRLVNDGMSYDDIDQTRVLPFHAGDIRQFPYRRDLPESKPQAMAGQHTYGRERGDMDEMFCSHAGCGQFGCLPHVANAAEYVYHPRPPRCPSGFTFSPRLIPCSDQCARIYTASHTPWPRGERSQLMDLLADFAQAHMSICDMRDFFSGRSCAEVRITAWRDRIKLNCRSPWSCSPRMIVLQKTWRPNPKSTLRLYRKWSTRPGSLITLGARIRVHVPLDPAFAAQLHCIAREIASYVSNTASFNSLSVRRHVSAAFRDAHAIVGRMGQHSAGQYAPKQDANVSPLIVNVTLISADHVERGACYQGNV